MTARERSKEKVTTRARCATGPLERRLANRATNPRVSRKRFNSTLNWMRVRSTRRGVGVEEHAKR